MEKQKYKIVDKRETIEWMANGNIKLDDVHKYFLIDMNSLEATSIEEVCLGGVFNSIDDEDIFFVRCVQ